MLAWEIESNCAELLVCVIFVLSFPLVCAYRFSSFPCSVFLFSSLRPCVVYLPCMLYLNSSYFCLFSNLNRSPSIERLAFVQPVWSRCFSFCQHRRIALPLTIRNWFLLPSIRSRSRKRVCNQFVFCFHPAHLRSSTDSIAINRHIHFSLPVIDRSRTLCLLRSFPQSGSRLQLLVIVVSSQSFNTNHIAETSLRQVCFRSMATWSLTFEQQWVTERIRTEGPKLPLLHVCFRYIATVCVTYHSE